MGNLLCRCLGREDNNIEYEDKSDGRRWVGISRVSTDLDYSRRACTDKDISDLSLGVYNLKSTTNWSKSKTGKAQYITLDENSTEYQIAKRKFDKTSKNRKYVLTKIERIENPYLLGQFLLKKEELLSRYGHIETDWLFHGTKSHNISKIVQNNFDWRLHGTSKGNIFGKGVSFSPFAGYAGNYCNDGNPKEILLCDVVVAKECYGNGDLVLPYVYNEEKQLRCDTAINKQRSVLVKFSDNEFYPLYKITFNSEI